MAAELTTKVRLVRCPKCRQLLPELPDIPVYKCGGCGAVLQGKSLYLLCLILLQTINHINLFASLVLHNLFNIGHCISN